MKAKMSACLIVKNEARWIESCLRSLVDWVDEIILVDTGSTDNTVELAKNLGAQVFYYPWEDDFAKARNYSLSKATCDWILVLDADEVISVSDRHLILDCIQNPQTPMYSLIQTTYCDESAVFGWIPNQLNIPEAKGYPGYLESILVRLFRNSGEIYFEGKVHEHVRHKNKTIRPLNSKARIHHYGKYVSTEVIKNKNDLYLKLGLEKCREEPENPHFWYELGVQYRCLGREKDAYNACLKAQSLDPNYVKNLVVLGGLSNWQKNYPEALRYYSRVMELEPTNIIPYLYLPTLLIERGDVSLARDILNFGYQYAKGHPSYHINRGLVSQHLGNHRFAIECFDEALRINPGEVLAIFNKCASYLKLEEYPLAEKFYKQIMNDSKVGSLVKKQLVLLYYKNNELDEALNLLNTAQTDNWIDDHLLLQKGVILLQKGAPHEAREVLDSIRKYDSFNETDLLNLKKCFLLTGDLTRADALDQFLPVFDKGMNPQSLKQDFCTGGAL